MRSNQIKFFLFFLISFLIIATIYFKNNHETINIMCNGILESRGIIINRIISVKDDILYFISTNNNTISFNLDNCTINWKQRSFADKQYNSYHLYGNKIFQYTKGLTLGSKIKYIELANGNIGEIQIPDNGSLNVKDTYNLNILYFLNKETKQDDNKFSYKDYIQAYDIDKEKLLWKIRIKEKVNNSLSNLNKLNIIGFYKNIILIETDLIERVNQKPYKRIYLIDSHSKEFFDPNIEYEISKMIKYNKYILLMKPAKELICYNLEDRKEVWTIKNETGSIIFNNLQLNLNNDYYAYKQFRPENEIIYLPISNNTITAFNLKTGKMIWKKKLSLNNEFLTNPIQYRNLVIFIGLSKTYKDTKMGYHIINKVTRKRIKSLYTNEDHSILGKYSYKELNKMFISNNKFYFRDKKQFRYIGLSPYFKD